MENIEYRCWDWEERRIAKVVGINFEDKEVSIIDSSSDWAERWLKDVVLMQYTGLKDINGIKIFAGDILLTKWAQEHGIIKGRPVEWVDASDDVESGFVGFQFPSRNVSENCQVIGNIYQDKELLL